MISATRAGGPGGAVTLELERHDRSGPERNDRAGQDPSDLMRSGDPNVRFGRLIAWQVQRDALDAMIEEEGRRPKPKPPTPQKGKRGKGQPAADDTELRIIESLANPAHRPLTVEQRCHVLGIARSTWYRHTAEPLFRARCIQAFELTVMDSLGPVLHALCESAVIEGKEGHPDRKFLLEHFDFGGAAGGGRRGDKDGPKKQGHQMTDAELVMAFEGRVHLMPPGVQRRLGQDPDAAKDVPVEHNPPAPPADRKAA